MFLVSSPCYVGITGAANLLDIDVTEPSKSGRTGSAAPISIWRSRPSGPRSPATRRFTWYPTTPIRRGPRCRWKPAIELLDLAARHDILIVEDSPYRMVSPAPHLPTLKSLDRQRRVIHLGSFSKTAFPGARVGFAVADQPVTDAAGHTGLLADELAKIKSMVTVNTPALSQAVIAGMLLACEGRVSELNAQQAAYYANAMRATLRSLDQCFPAEQRCCARRALERARRRILSHDARPVPGG